MFNLHGKLDEPTFVQGIVRDSLTMQGIPYASVRLLPGGNATIADSLGLFELNAPAGSTLITASSQGYAPKSVELVRTSHNLYDIQLSAQAQELKEVVVRKRKYSKRNNPAVDFVRRIRQARELTDPRRNDFYNYSTYQRITLGINDFDTAANSATMRRMPFLAEHIESSEIDGKPVLFVSLKDQRSDFHSRRSDDRTKNIVQGTRSNGVDEIIDASNTETILNDLLRPVDLYDNDINLLKNTFVSPLSPLAPDFYRFYLTDSAAVVPGSDTPHIALAFYPRNKASFGFVGHIYVPAADTTMFISRVEMQTSNEVNLNFIKELHISQDYEKAPDGSRLKQSDNLLMVMSVLPGLPELYVSRKISYRDHNFEPPADADSIFSLIGAGSVAADAADRDSAFWERVRREPQREGEDKADRLLANLRKQKLFFYGERLLRNMVQGYWPTGRNSRFDIGPVNTTASYNSLEGLRLRAGGMTTANLSSRWFGRGYVAYGFRDRKWKYSAEAEYSFNDKKYHSREFPVHSLRLTHRYDIDRIGSHYLYTNADNFVLSLTRDSDRKFSYLRDTKLEYTLELNNNLSFLVTADYARQEATQFLPFITGDGRHLSHFDEASICLQLRYAPGEKFYQAKSFRIPVNEEAPVFVVSHKFAPGGVLGSTYTVNRTEASFSKRFSLSVLGALDASLHGGHVWGTAPFPELLIPNSNLSYIIQPESFALMNPMEFINSSYVSLFLSWNLRGALFNLVPGVKKLGIREVVSFSGLYGRLSGKNRPTATSPLFLFPQNCGLTDMHRPYMEVAAGLDNIFHILRVDYVWRLSYLNVPYHIDRRGIRVAMHFTF